MRKISITVAAALVFASAASIASPMCRVNQSPVQAACNSGQPVQATACVPPGNC